MWPKLVGMVPSGISFESSFDHKDLGGREAHLLHKSYKSKALAFKIIILAVDFRKACRATRGAENSAVSVLQCCGSSFCRRLILGKHLALTLCKMSWEESQMFSEKGAHMTLPHAHTHTHTVPPSPAAKAVTSVNFHDFAE